MWNASFLYIIKVELLSYHYEETYIYLYFIMEGTDYLRNIIVMGLFRYYWQTLSYEKWLPPAIPEQAISAIRQTEKQIICFSMWQLFYPSKWSFFLAFRMPFSVSGRNTLFPNNVILWFLFTFINVVLRERFPGILRKILRYLRRRVPHRVPCSVYYVLYIK